MYITHSAHISNRDSALEIRDCWKEGFGVARDEKVEEEALCVEVAGGLLFAARGISAFCA